MRKRALSLACIAGLLLSQTACKPVCTHIYTQQITKAACYIIAGFLKAGGWSNR